jgi:hypothetical protein
MAILRSRRFKFKMYERRYLQQLKVGVATLENPFRQHDYHAWLCANHLVDNDSNRIAWLTAANAKAGLEESS